MELEYQCLRKIGEGEHGSVYLVQKNKKGKQLQNIEAEEQLYAMKKIPLSNNYFDFQAKLLLSLNHPNVIQVNQVLEQKQHLVLILQLAQEGDLHQFIKRNYFKKVPQHKVVSWLCQLCLGMYYLHNENNIIHRDIKLRNILVKENGLLKLADFGVAKKLEKGEDFARTSVGTPCYLSPESINLGRYDNKSDVWSLGCLLYEICTGEKPFHGESLGTLLHNIVNNSFGEIPIKYSAWLRQLISSMLQKNPQKRPTILQILQNPQIRKQFKSLKQAYPEYEKIIYPEEGPKTTKYLDIDDKKLNSLKIFSQSLKTTKNDRSIRLQIEEKNSGSESGSNKQKSQDVIQKIKNQPIVIPRITIDTSSKNSFGALKPRIPQKNLIGSIQVKAFECLNLQKTDRKPQFSKSSSISCSLNKIANNTSQTNTGNRKVQRDKFLDKSLKSIIANRNKDKGQKKSGFRFQ